MSFGKRRPKLSRAQLRPSNPIAIQQGRLARQRDRLARLAVVARRRPRRPPPSSTAPGPRSPSGSASGPTASSGSTSPSSSASTRRRRTPSGRPRPTRSPPSMVNDPAPIRDLAEPARRPDRSPIAKSPGFEALPENLRATWKLDPDDLRRAQGGHRHARAARRRCTRQIAAAFEPLDPRRRARPRHAAPQRGVEPRPCRSATSARRPSEAHLVPRERVVPERIAKPDGPVCQEFVAAFTSPRLGQILFRLVADKLDGHADADLRASSTPPRSASRPANRVQDIYDTYRRGDVLVEQDQTIGEEQLILLRAGARDGHREPRASATGSAGRARSSSSSPPCSP